MTQAFKRVGPLAMAAATVALACGSGGGKAKPDGGSGGADGSAFDAPAETAPPFVPPPPVESTITPAGGTISLPGFADVTFPAGAFASDQIVRLEATADAELADQWRSSTAIFQLAGRTPYEIVLTVGGAAPLAGATVRLDVPGALAPTIQVGAYAYLLTASEEDTLDQFLPIAVTSRDAASLTLALPGDHFQPLRPGDGRLQVVLALGRARDAGATSAAGSRLAFDDTDAPRLGAGACAGETIGPPLASITVTSAFNPERRQVVRDDAGVERVYIGHWGADYRSPNGTPLYATWDGTVVLSERSRSFGETVVIAMDDDKGAVRYAHMMTRDVAVGAKVCRGQLIGTADTTGLVTGPHLHFEYAPAGNFGSNAAMVDPTPCIDTSLPVPQTCGRWTGMIHVVEMFTQSRQTVDATTTVTFTRSMRSEHRWTFGDNHPDDPSLGGATAIDLSWAGKYQQDDKTVTTYSSIAACEMGKKTEELTAMGMGSKPSQLAISEFGNERSLAIIPHGNVLNWPSTTTLTDCRGAVTVLPPGSVALIEFVSFANVAALTTLQPSPSDPNTFTGSGTVLHSESATMNESSVLDIQVDWDIRRNPNF